MDFSNQRRKNIFRISGGSHSVLYTFNTTFMECFLQSKENVFLLDYFLGLASTVLAPNGPLENLLLNSNISLHPLNLAQVSAPLASNEEGVQDS
jgi:hypothetical protein